MLNRTSRVLSWTQISMVMLFSYMLTSAAMTEDGNNVINYPPQNYLSWSKVGDIPWLVNYTNGYNDTSRNNDRICLKSGPIKCGGESKLRMENISGPAIIQFKWKIDAGQRIGQLVFNIDGKNAFECYSRDWTDFSYPLSPERPHSLEWSFKKIKSYPLWDGAGWIDNIDLIKLNSQESETHSDQNGSDIIIGEKICNQSMVINCSGNSWNDVINISDKSPRQMKNYAYSNKDGSNITILVENIIYSRNDLNTNKSNIIIKAQSPKENDILSDEVELQFEYTISNCSRITNCTLMIDNLEKAYSHNIKSDLNKFRLNRDHNEVGGHEWKIKCCECGGLCNFSKEVYFKLAEYSDRTYVDPLNPDEAHFRYPTISQALTNTSDFGEIIVEKGTYRESITINRSVTIIGENRPLLLPGPGEDEKGIIIINHSDVEIKGVVLKNSKYGIHIAGKKENNLLKNITIRENDISACASEIFAEYCKDSIIKGNSIYYSNKSDNCLTGIQLNYCNNMTIEFNKLNEESVQLEGAQRMQTCINMLSCDEKTIKQIKDNIFEYTRKAINIREGNGQYNKENLIILLKENNNQFGVEDSDIVGDGGKCS